MDKSVTDSLRPIIWNGSGEYIISCVTQSTLVYTVIYFFRKHSPHTIEINEIVTNTSFLFPNTTVESFAVFICKKKTDCFSSLRIYNVIQSNCFDGFSSSVLDIAQPPAILPLSQPMTLNRSQFWCCGYASSVCVNIVRRINRHKKKPFLSPLHDVTLCFCQDLP